MSTNTTKQAGFATAVAVVIAVLAICVLGYGGYRVYSHFSKQVSNTTSSTQTGTTSTQPAPTYLDIKELGIKIKLDDSIKDAAYSAKTLSDGAVAYLSTASLTTQSKGACSASNGGVVSIGKTTNDTDQVFGTKLVPNNTTIFKLGSDFITLVH